MTDYIMLIFVVVLITTFITFLIRTLSRQNEKTIILKGITNILKEDKNIDEVCSDLVIYYNQAVEVNNQLIKSYGNLIALLLRYIYLWYYYKPDKPESEKKQIENEFGIDFDVKPEYVKKIIDKIRSENPYLEFEKKTRILLESLKDKISDEQVSIFNQLSNEILSLESENKSNREENIKTRINARVSLAFTIVFGILSLILGIYSIIR